MARNVLENKIYCMMIAACAMDASLHEASIVPEGATQLVAQRSGEIAQYRTLAGLEIGVDRHAGQDVMISQFLQLRGWNGQGHTVIALPRRRIGNAVRRDTRDRAKYFGGGASVERGKDDLGLLPLYDLVNRVWINAYLEIHPVRNRNDLQDRLARRHDTAGIEDLHFMHDSIYWGNDLNPIELFAGGDDLQMQLFALHHRLSQVGDHLFLELPFRLQDLKLGVANGIADSVQFRLMLGNLAEKPRSRALQFEHLSLARQPFRVQRTDISQLLLDKGQLIALGLDHPVDTGNLVVELRDLLAELILAALHHLAPSVENLRLTGIDLRQRQPVEICGVVIEDHIPGIHLFSLQPADLGAGFGQAIAIHLQIDAQQCWVEPQQHIARAYHVAIVDADLFDDPAVEVLDYLWLAAHDGRAGGNDRAADRRHIGPAEDHGQHCQTGKDAETACTRQVCLEGRGGKCVCGHVNALTAPRPRPDGECHSAPRP